VKANGWKTFWKILLSYVIPLGLGIAILWYLAIIYQSDPTAFWPRASLTIASIAAIFAGLSALVASRSLEKTKESLELTRNTQRPFLNVSRCAPVWSKNDNGQTTVNYFVVDITNTGIFPADKISVLFNICEAGGSQKRLLTTTNHITSICFPNDVMQNLIFKEPDDENKLRVQPGDKIKVQIEISYKNKLTNKPHKTIRSYLAQDVPLENEKIIPLPEEDYWD